MAKLLSSGAVVDVRRDIGMLLATGREWVGRDYGILEIVPATGRATCRQCGRRIVKGEPAAAFCYDFTGAGSWTVVHCYMHFKDCGNAAGTGR